MYLRCKNIFAVIIMLACAALSQAQVAPLWESSMTFGDKGTLYSFGGAAVQYYFVLDTVGKQCKVYNADTFASVSTIPLAGSLEYPYILVPDMNGNGQPEIVMQDYAYTGYAVRIVDIVTGAEIKAWKETVNSYYFWSLFKTPGSSTIKISMYKTNLISYQSSLVVFSLGVAGTGVPGQSWNIKEASFRLNQNFPNPFNPTTMISFDVPEDGDVKLAIFDELGRSVAALIDGKREAGHYDVPFNGRNLPSGSYFYQVTAGKNISTKKMLMIK